MSKAGRRAAGNLPPRTAGPASRAEDAHQGPVPHRPSTTPEAAVHTTVAAPVGATALHAPEPPLLPPPLIQCTLQDLCPDDKAKVAKLLKQIVDLGRENQVLKDGQAKAASDSEAQLAQVGAAAQQMARENVGLKGRLGQMLTVLKTYQQRVCAMDAALRAAAEQRQQPAAASSGREEKEVQAGGEAGCTGAGVDGRTDGDGQGQASGGAPPEPEACTRSVLALPGGGAITVTVCHSHAPTGVAAAQQAISSLGDGCQQQQQAERAPGSCGVTPEALQRAAAAAARAAAQALPAAAASHSRVAGPSEGGGRRVDVRGAAALLQAAGYGAVEIEDVVPGGHGHRGSIALGARHGGGDNGSGDDDGEHHTACPQPMSPLPQPSPVLVCMRDGLLASDLAGALAQWQRDHRQGSAPASAHSDDGAGNGGAAGGGGVPPQALCFDPSIGPRGAFYLTELEPSIGPQRGSGGGEGGRGGTTAVETAAVAAGGGWVRGTGAQYVQQQQQLVAEQQQQQQQAGVQARAHTLQQQQEKQEKQRAWATQVGDAAMRPTADATAAPASPVAAWAAGLPGAPWQQRQSEAQPGAQPEAQAEAHHVDQAHAQQQGQQLGLVAALAWQQQEQEQQQGRTAPAQPVHRPLASQQQQEQLHEQDARTPPAHPAHRPGPPPRAPPSECGSSSSSSLHRVAERLDALAARHAWGVPHASVSAAAPTGAAGAPPASPPGGARPSSSGGGGHSDSYLEENTPGSSGRSNATAVARAPWAGTTLAPAGAALALTGGSGGGGARGVAVVHVGGGAPVPPPPRAMRATGESGVGPGARPSSAGPGAPSRRDSRRSQAPTMLPSPARLSAAAASRFEDSLMDIVLEAEAMEAELQGVSCAVYQLEQRGGGHGWHGRGRDGWQHAGVGKGWGAGAAALEESVLLAAILMEELAI
ncbi:hypothetical protein FOA52_011899 [Chlamydomonas sp. UWO 241]|nr:hypothetical protein FOA52_011899 [Chlamydomonas sp. UWO 241]